MNTYIDTPDNQLINEIKENQSSDALNTLAVRHSGLVFDMAKKFGTNITSGTPYYDLESELPEIVWEAAKQFDETKGVKFDTWLGNNVKYYCLKKINKAARQPTDSIEEHPNEVTNIVNSEIMRKEEEANELAYVLDIAGQMSDPRIEGIIKERYFSGPKVKNFADIGKKFDLSPQGVKNIHDAFLKKARSKLMSDNYVDVV